ncbi:MAG: 50S ribosomal protein L23 [Thiotrichales bacterium 32-46-8]|jgi:large subunit ribosomal protein L23|nr:50S ribosomal protein L23 [Gammaproteobacteria bacterium]OYX05788.1 MAG: 50S ribosomal protein L23 [Thiotrichales bacterium 32-46-8]OYY24198.1 MAG: 50S ribosomal protein L23 [Thiotrichales bacterium 35-46-9]OYZ07597.1 MAG: 50S ribosomal protein L23 [Thiotrichales bacterium 16-46-22]OYZ42723.1 MAG: 50S ribosomal protein L23 [Thiotrichales bacterium 24-47-4]OZA20347.1 MAG: 50S ribosomal protein L23 [Thiotrichales bacterium 17-46-47]OZA73726.1 MAG: 50S ribosomal protein L23 [Thiotrichales bac
MNQERIYTVIRAPRISEKSARMAENSKYVFDVDTTATKAEIKTAIEALFNVTVNAVNVINIAGKRKVFKGRSGRRNGLRKAIVSLQPGQQIELMSAE